MSETNQIDLQVPVEDKKTRTPSPKKTIEAHSETVENKNDSDSKNIQKPIRVGINILAHVLAKRMTREQVKNIIQQLPNRGSKVAKMYFLDELEQPLNLTLNEINIIKGKVRNPNAKRVTTKEKIARGIMINEKEKVIISNKAKIDALLEANRKLRKEIKDIKAK